MRTPAVDLTQALAEHAAAIRALRSRIVSDVAEIGRRLVEVKQLVGHGNWMPWLGREFGWSSDTAERFIQVYEFVGGLSNSATVRNLILTLPVSAVYAIAARSTPAEARDQIIERAQAGESVSVANVKQTIEFAKRGIVTGVSMRLYADRGLDFYETPPEATRALLDVESFDGVIWEPANGRGAISRVLRAAGHRVVATDIADYGAPDAIAGVDFLTQLAAPDGVKIVVTNPPFRFADEFVRRTLILVPRAVFLLGLAFLEGVGRSDFLDSGQLARVHVFRNRISMHRDGWTGPRESSAIAFGWFVWDAAHRGPTELRRISWTDEAPVHPKLVGAAP
jgi:hypothetical protein